MAVTRIPLPDWARTKKADDRLGLPLAEIELAVRTVNCLEEEGLLTVRQLLNCTPQRLMEIPNFGAKTLQTVYEALEKVGFCRRSRRDEQEREGDYALLESTFH